MPNGTYGGVRGKETKIGRKKTFVSLPTRFSFTYGYTTPVKSRSVLRSWRISGCKSGLDRLSHCEIDHICRVDTEEDQHDFCRFYPRRYLSKTVMFLLGTE